MNIEHILNNGQEAPTLTQQMDIEDAYKLQNIGVDIVSLNHQLTYPNCAIEITEESISVVLSSFQQNQKVINLLFSNISSVGIQDNKIMIFLEGQEDQDQAISENQDGTLIMPQILKLINDSATGTFNIQGNFTLSLSFGQQNEQKKKQAHEIIVGYLKSEEQEDDENFMDEMISADQINEDGTINKFNHEQQESEEDEDDQEEQKK